MQGSKTLSGCQTCPCCTSLRPRRVLNCCWYQPASPPYPNHPCCNVAVTTRALHHGWTHLLLYPRGFLWYNNRKWWVYDREGGRALWADNAVPGSKVMTDKKSSKKKNLGEQVNGFAQFCKNPDQFFRIVMEGGISPVKDGCCGNCVPCTEKAQCSTYRTIQKCFYPCGNLPGRDGG